MMDPLAMVNRYRVLSSPWNDYMPLDLRTARPILVTCGCEMILSGLSDGG
jgi:hypothetical protein